MSEPITYANPLRGIAFKVIAVALFMAMATCIKAVADHVPPGQTVFFRSLFAIPVILIWLGLAHNLRDGLKTANPMGHFWRGLVGTTAMGLSFAALGLLPLPEVTAIGYAAPLLVVIFAAMFLGEEVRLFRLSAVALGLVGVVIVLSPRLSVLRDGSATDTEALGALLMLMSAVFMALAQIFVRKLTLTEKTPAIVFWFSVSASSLALLTIPFGWVMPTGGEFALLILAGLLGGVAQIFLTNSYRMAPASVIAPFEYVSMLMALAVGYTLFDEVPTRTMLIGASLVMAAGLLIIWRERQLGIRRGSRRALTPQG
ncbi:drug/metabolite transporter (DMT)-like permease [Rubricella aquisinus]|uniref:Drug/metabolite transporter (DMT)-like permease n=1 Tax=Rubricella aquisinus TaxID=2028108 RepID=A0A840X2D8_9RHOB|nr:DMT family transporter [Rubricella aquisinus]MBB5516016.1 drug/metabolite transporter (DMT)-like permease [Rubricella aquisinus]